MPTLFFARKQEFRPFTAILKTKKRQKNPVLAEFFAGF
jgi:hypothetical protein